MKTKTRVWLITVMVSVAALAVLGYVFLSGRYSTQELSQAEVQKQPEVIGARYALDFLAGTDRSRVANAYVVGSWEKICTVQISIWHEKGTIVDEVSFTFASIYYDALSLKTPDGYPWPLAQFQKTTDGEGVIYSIPDAGFQGTGTMDFKFYIRKDILGSIASHADEISMHVDFTMHRNGILKATKQHAEGDIRFMIP